MGAIADLAIPNTGAIAATPIPDTGESVTPQRADAEATQAIQGGFRRGLRSSMISLGGALNALASGVGENLGLSEFAADRMHAAEADMAEADAVGPRVRDFRGIKDLADVVDFTSGLAGEGAGSLVPIGAGAAVGGLRGAAAALFPVETGSQLFRTRNAPASAAKRLGAAAAEGAAATAAGLVVPASAASKVANRTAGGVLAETGKAAAGMGALSAGQEYARQAAHTFVEPGRDKSDDTAGIINAALGGAVAGAPLGAAAGAAGRARTLAEARKELGGRERPSKLDPDLDKVPDDAEGIGKALDEHDAKVDQELEGMQGEAWAKKYEGWQDDPEKRDAFHEEAVARHREEVDRPQARSALERLGKFMDRFRPEAPEGQKASKVRTALDMAVFDNMVRHLPEHVQQAMTPQEKIQLADHVRDFALHTAGRSEEQPGPGAPDVTKPIRPTRPAKSFDTFRQEIENQPETREGPRPRQRVIPHELMDIFGDQLHPLLDSTQRILMKGGLKTDKVNWKKAVAVATKSRGRLGAQLDDVVRAHIDPSYLEDPQTREYAVGQARDRVMQMVQSGKFDEPLLDKLFGKGKADVLDAFDQQREDVTRGYESFEDMPEPRTDESTAAKLRRNENFRVSEEDEYGAGPAEPTEPEPNPVGEQESRAEEAHPFRDKRLGVPMTQAEAARHLEALRSEAPALDGRVKYKVQVHDDGRVSLHAEDGAAQVGFDAEARDRIRDTQGKAGLENGVVTVVMKDQAREGRNEQVPVSLVRLTNEAVRSGDVSREGGYLKNAVLEGLSRLMSDPDFVRMKEGNQLENIPDETPVARARGRTYTWGEVMGRGLSAKELQMKQSTSDMAERARFAGSREEIEGEIRPQLRGDLRAAEELVRSAEQDTTKAAADLAQAKKDGVKWDDRKPLWKAWKDAERKEQDARIARNRYQEALDEVQDELDRRSEEGDAPIYDSRGVADTEEVREGVEQKTERTPRGYQEETGESLAYTGRAPRGPTPGEVAGSVKHSMFDVDGREWEIRKTESGKYYIADAKTMATSGRLYDSADAAREQFMHERAKKQYKLSEVRLGKEPMSEEQRSAVRGEIERLLGPRAKVAIEASTQAGKFIGAGPEESIIISTHALDPMGTARHEAMHALMARLAKTATQAANTIMNAAHSPVVQAQLRKLLAGHEEALRQLADPEERAAYMYEFWAQGALKVGEQTGGLFGKIREWLHQVARSVLGVGEDVKTLRQADELLQAFHRGDMADRSTVAEVASKLVPRDTLRETWVGAVGDWADRVWSTADGYIRDQGIPAFTEAADKFLSPHDQPGTPSGMMQTRHTVFNRFMNRYAVAMRGLDEKATNRVLESLQRGDESLVQGAAEASARRAIRGMLDDVYDYMVEKGVKAVEWNEETRKYDEHDLRRVSDFFPRMYDRAAIEAKRGEFEALLERYAVKNPKAVVDKMLTSAKGSPEESDSTAGITYYAPDTMARKLAIPEAELAPFMKKDLGAIMYDYVRYATRRGEYASRFGNQGQGIKALIDKAVSQGASEDQVKQFSRYVQAMEGTLGNHISGGMRKFFSGVLAYQNWRLLPLSLFSSLVDPNGIIMRGGTVQEGFGAFVRGVRELVSNKEDEARHFARAIGAITDASEDHMVADMYGMNQGSKWAKWLNDTLFRYNGMESWNNSMRTAAAAAARNFIIRHATEPSRHSERWLSELGLRKDDVHVSQQGELELTPQVVDALNKWVDGAVLRPHAGTRPIWGSDPHYMLMIHLKQFAYSFQKTITSQAVHELMHGNFRPAAVLASYVPFIIAADVLRSLVTPGSGDNDRYAKWGAKDWLAHGINRAGIDGPGQYLGDSLSDIGRGKSGLAPLLGPTFQQIEDLGRATLGARGTSFQTEALRSVPLVPTLFPGKLDRIANED